MELNDYWREQASITMAISLMIGGFDYFGGDGCCCCYCSSVWA